jgi:citrate synthase
MTDADDDQRQLLKDLGATAEQTVQEVRGFEENCYALVQGTMMALPWAADFNKKIQSYAEQNFATAFAFARELSEAKDMQDVFRIYGDYNQKYLQSMAAQVRDFAATSISMASGAIRAPSLTLE